MEKTNRHKIYGLSLITAFLLIQCAFLYVLIDTAFLPVRITIICGLVLALVSVFVYLLVKNSKKKVSTVIGTMIAVLIVFAQFCVGYYVTVGINALEQITTPGTEYTEMGVFVKKDDPAKKIADTKGYVFAVLKEQDKNASAIALEQLSDELGEQLKVKTCLGITDLMDWLLKPQDKRAIVLNKALLELLEEIEGYTGVRTKIREIHTIKVESDAVPEHTEEKSEDVFKVYISGIDCYGSISRRSRSDVNILATVNVKTGQILLVSTPRDYYVPLSISNGVPDKLTHAGIYGVDVSKDTLEMLYDTEIDYYFRVNFDGFKDIIDSLGGITVNSEYSFKSGKYSYNKGANHLNGEQALYFSRERYSLPGGDRQRGKNQMEVIRAIIDKATSTALLKNYKDIMDGVAGSFETSVPYKRISTLIQRQIKDLTAWNVVSYSVDGTGAARKPYSLSTNAYVMLPNKATVKKAKTLIKQVENGKRPRP